ncbi:T9SS type A sorting domain-containing protein, partial [candidate division KSB1 bacterium]|nr:T9SS type A sorting domain-containing protein [candidate division KSB1 bacterium]
GDPNLAGISRDFYANALDPRPEADGLAYQNLAEITTDVNNLSFNKALPVVYELAQNYPNPFNPVTTIMYKLPEIAKVKLAVYNVLGKEISILVNEILSAGEHKVQFNASHLSSGLYFYRLEAGSMVISKKLMLIK